MKKRITAILAAAIITVGASVPAFADSDFNTAGNDAQVLLTAQEAQADTALDTLDAISDDSAAVVLSDNYDTAAINHGPHASARAVMAQQIPHQEEAQVSLQDGVEQIDVDRQYCVEKGSGIMKSKLKSVSYQSGAADYVVPDSFKLNDSRDVYLYSTVTKTERQTDKDR